MTAFSIRRSTMILLVAVLVSLLASNVALLTRTWWTNQQWEAETNGMASYAGAMQGLADFHGGILRQYELCDGGQIEDTKQRDGAFEIWRWPYHPSLGHGHILSSQRFVETYNSNMRHMNQHPEEFGFNTYRAPADTTRPTTE
jgi:hypothetical protein